MAMRQVYAPANDPEAHILVHLLGQSGINAHIHGEALQSGVGELPAGGLLRLLVAEEDYDAARTIILNWEREQPAPEASAPAPKRGGLVPIAVASLVGGVVGWIANGHLTLPIDSAEVTVDSNRDGVPDTTYFYRVGGTYAHRSETDANFDNAVDVRIRFNENGVPTSAQADQDFDGFFETTDLYEDGNVIRTEVDTNKNGVADIVHHARFGVVRRSEYMDNANGRLVRVEYFNNLRLSHSEHDLDGDGFRETARRYDAVGEVESTETRAR